MPVVSPLPARWKAVDDEATDADFQQAWQAWRHINPYVAPTAAEELQREIDERHPLYGLDCQLLAWDPGTTNDYLY